ncbi:hypothetical protein PLICRDRAFT_454601 [Plicaturopsis crispa FD-325 SS-3]|uniref:Uncharacterized protein n=1 Tax=Plicaturopsis crispa FD-325 SS-3 TaxID=944288 RepID=A0A0C9SQ44_PLICR|nr:hypothetical protein PLICRDRAFT_454601 [Plicaturopsis crispa FD-325 SS-3]
MLLQKLLLELRLAIVSHRILSPLLIVSTRPLCDSAAVFVEIVAVRAFSITLPPPGVRYIRRLQHARKPRHHHACMRVGSSAHLIAHNSCRCVMCWNLLGARARCPDPAPDLPPAASPSTQHVQSLFV